GVFLREKKLLGHLTIRGDAHDQAFAAGVQKALGMELPAALMLVINGESSLQWLGPDEWLLRRPVDSRADRPESASRIDEIHQLRRPPGQLPGGQGRRHGVRQITTGDPQDRRRDLGAADPPQLLGLLVAVVAGCKRRVRAKHSGVKSPGDRSVSLNEDSCGSELAHEMASTAPENRASGRSSS
ncbi:sarcosine oxidase, gamma subunit, partial [Pseudomonas syringae pv. actinidiae ICMP 19096]